MNTEKQPLHIVSLETENVKRLTAVRITPDGSHCVIVGGDNEQGKSSVLDSILIALAGEKHFPDVPVRQGEDAAEVNLDLGEFKVRRRITKGGTTTLTITNPDGSKRTSPQGILDAMVGKLLFDPLAFTKQKPKEQWETLRRIAGLDFSPLDSERQNFYDRRTEAGRELDLALAQRKTAFDKLPPNYQPAEGVDVNALVQKLNAAHEKNRDNEGQQTRAAGRVKDYESAEALIRSDTEALKRNRASIAEMIKATDALEAGINRRLKVQAERRSELEAEVARVNALVDEGITPIQKQLEEAQTTNRNAAAHDEMKAAEKVSKEKQIEADKFTARINEIDATKAKMIAEAKYPVPGLAILPDGSGILFNGLPFSQASSAAQLRVSMAIGLALNPRLRVLLIRDGSLLDANSLRLVAEMAQEANAQIWMERVSLGAECSVIIENGAIKKEA